MVLRSIRDMVLQHIYKQLKSMDYVQFIGEALQKISLSKQRKGLKKKLSSASYIKFKMKLFYKKESKNEYTRSYSKKKR